MSTSSHIQTLEQRFLTWKGRCCGASKIEEGNLDDVLIMPQNRKWTLHVVRQSLLGGFDPFARESNLEPPMIAIHAGVPRDIKCDSGDPEHRWMTPQEFGELVLARKQAFRKSGGPGVPVSTSLLTNYFGKGTLRQLWRMLPHVCCRRTRAAKVARECRRIFR